MVDKVKGGVKRGCVHFDTPSFFFLSFSRIRTFTNFNCIMSLLYPHPCNEQPLWFSLFGGV